jgi:hypothetical protein
VKAYTTAHVLGFRCFQRKFGESSAERSLALGLDTVIYG